MRKTFSNGKPSLRKLNTQSDFNMHKLFINCCRGPEGTCFEGGVFPAKLIFPPDYPLSPPKMQFTCEMFHPNSKLSKVISSNVVTLFYFSIF